MTWKEPGQEGARELPEEPLGVTGLSLSDKTKWPCLEEQLTEQGLPLQLCGGLGVVGELDSPLEKLKAEWLRPLGMMVLKPMGLY